MKKGSSFWFFSSVLCVCFGLVSMDALQAKDNEMTAEQVIAANLKSIGPSEVVAGVKNRGISGQSFVTFILGGIGKMAGQGVILTAGSNLGIIMKYGGVEYPGEYLAFDGKDVTIGTIKPGQRSPLGDFIFRYNQIMKEGLFGGVLSLGWPLYHLEDKKPDLKYDRAKIDGQDLHEIEYIPKKGMNGIKVKLYFEPETYRHVRTEYRLKVKGEQSLQNGQSLTRGSADSSQTMQGGGAAGITRNAGIQDAMYDSIYVLVEKFEDFKVVDKMTLPQRYTINYSNEGHGNSFVANWTIQADQIIHNGKINQSLFKAQ
jgi:hypothetical protein